MSAIKSQILGLFLAITTAMGTIAYERLVKEYSLGLVALVTFSFYVPLLIIYFSLKWVTWEEVHTAITHNPGSIATYWLTWCTIPIWYIITKNQGAMVASLYEVKYIVILAVFYIFFGENKFTINTAFGLFCAIGSIYFISKK